MFVPLRVAVPFRALSQEMTGTELGLDKFCRKNFEQNKRFLRRAFCRLEQNVGRIRENQQECVFTELKSI